MRYGTRSESLSGFFIRASEDFDNIPPLELLDSDDDFGDHPLPSPSLQPKRHGLPKHRRTLSAPRYRRRRVILGTIIGAFVLLYIILNLRRAQRTIEIDTGKALVIASYRDQDVSWTAKVPPDWKIYRYYLDDPNPHHDHSIARDQGREATAYLSFIIENYHSLPNYTVFAHGHERAWHQIEPMGLKIRALNLTALDNDEYISMRCANKPGCSSPTLVDFSNLWWGPIGYLPDFMATAMPEEPIPNYIGAPCCGQFAVSKSAILKRPFDFWLRLRTPLTGDLSEYNATWGGNRTHYGVDKYSMGMMFEWTWHIIFGKDPVYCPNEDYCRQVQFSDAIQCDRYVGLWTESAGWEDIECTINFDEGVHNNSFSSNQFLDTQALIEAVPPDMGKQPPPGFIPPNENDEEPPQDLSTNEPSLQEDRDVTLGFVQLKGAANDPNQPQR